MKAGRRNIEISNEDKVIYQGQGVKADIINYYKEVAPLMLPHLANRPLMLQRFPDGIHKNGFYQKEASDYFPNWIKTATVSKEGGKVNHTICNNVATLVYLANQATIAFHTWLSIIPEVNYPDKFIIDLDPPSDEFVKVRTAALIIKSFFDEIGVTSFVMTTGSSGVHIVVPLDGKATFDQSRKIGGKIAIYLTRWHSDVFTTEKFIKKREGKIYFDIQRNGYAQTAVSPYSLRPLPHAPIATPLHWSELDNKNIHSRAFNISNILDRLAVVSDPWKGMRRHATGIQRLTMKLKKVPVSRVS
ncbi:non-homologous end-joining DNA ligase [Fulvivirga ulvae]|uniref:non-homologous end-joining DNA ligase n=1 Tax=Fulvivirga ulvae TaxID=2904245 RepID=UPI001F3ECFB7|nr:non-homologous end-joining DNA ligase [Fulvivirga ulvae]UII31399.1 non-homologous end-joining DNA ligase [Fulvivirga ulvae]